ncbi:hypothetical protein [Aquamicrobium sp.]|uniref:hypothetical protein n=1 Tax=Aquamicrobium sp. TaxID=1872579 RepID=UPI00258A724F|nr:hypothetical protein [Aquamicrobium sp.]MCK9549480.1 hypothetical protein [Aquamicrobium sp.]
MVTIRKFAEDLKKSRAIIITEDDTTGILINNWHYEIDGEVFDSEYDTPGITHFISFQFDEIVKIQVVDNVYEVLLEDNTNLRFEILETKKVEI